MVACFDLEEYVRVRTMHGYSLMVDAPMVLCVVYKDLRRLRCNVRAFNSRCLQLSLRGHRMPGPCYNQPRETANLPTWQVQ